MLTLLLLACHPDPGPAVDSAPACAPLSVERGQGFTAAELLPEGTDPESHPYEQGPGVAIADYDGDGWLDLFVAMGVGHSLLLRNDAGVLTVLDLPMEDGQPLPAANGVAAADLDGDGDTDLVLSRRSGVPDLLLENLGDARFTPQILPDSPGESMAAALGDADGDGDIDLLLPGFVDAVALPLVERGLQVGDGHRLLHNAGGLRFEDASAELPPELVEALTYQAVFFDADDDGDQDLYFANDFGRYLEPNRLLLREGAERVSPPACFCELAMNGMGVAVGDVNGDALPDLFVAGWGGNALLVNDGRSGFTESSAARGAVPANPDSQVAWGGVFFDPDQDGDLDLAWANGPVYIPPEDEPNPFGIGDVAAEEPDTLALNDGTGHYADLAGSLGFGDTRQGRSVTVGDLDRDGRPDLVLSGRVYLDIYYSRGGCDPGLSLRLDGGPGNREGLGARVDVSARGFTRSYWMQPGAVFGASAAEIYAGLAGAPEADLRVTWPDGAQTELAAQPAGELVIYR